VLKWRKEERENSERVKARYREEQKREQAERAQTSKLAKRTSKAAEAAQEKARQESADIEWQGAIERSIKEGRPLKAEPSVTSIKVLGKLREPSLEEQKRRNAIAKLQAEKREAEARAEQQRAHQEWMHKEQQRKKNGGC
jgi:hypothetical protein